MLALNHYITPHIFSRGVWSRVICSIKHVLHHLDISCHYNSFFYLPKFKCKCRNFNAKLIMAWECWMDGRVYLWVAACTVQYRQYSCTVATACVQYSPALPGLAPLHYHWSPLSCDQALAQWSSPQLWFTLLIPWSVLCVTGVMSSWTGVNTVIMVFDSSGSSEGGRAVWMENVMPQHPPPSSMGLRSLPPYQPPPTPSRYNFPTYTSPWLVRVSSKRQRQSC